VPLNIARMPIPRARGRASQVLLLAMSAMFGGSAMLVGSAACTRGDACQDKLAAMRRTLEAIPAGAATQQVAILAPDFPLLTSANGEVLRAAGPVVRLNADSSANLEGGDKHFEAGPMIVEATEALSRPGHDRVLYLAIAPGVALGPHSALIRGLGEQAPLRVLIRGATGGLAAPTPSPAMATRLAAIRAASPHEKPVLLADAMGAVAADCKPMAAGFESIASAAPDKRQGALINAALTGADQCGCEVVDIDGLSALIWTLTMGDGPRLRWLPLLPGPAGIKLPADARTGDLVRLLEAGPAIALPE